MSQDDSPHSLLQAVRPVHKNNLTPTISAAIAYVVIHTDPSSGKNIILWDDVQQAFKDALHVRHGAIIIPFLKGTDFKNLDPPRFAAISGATLDVVVDGQFTSTDPPLRQSSFDEILNQASQYPKYDPLDSMRSANSPRDARSSSGNNYSHEIPNDRTMPNSAFWDQGHVPIQHARAPSRPAQTPPSRPPTSRPIPPRPPALRTSSTHKPRARMDVKEAFRRIITHIDLVALEEKGEGTPEEFTKALQCYLKSVCRGHGHAHLSVGELFAQGEDVVQDESRAFEWYLKAAYQGNAVAQRKISRIIFNQPNRSTAAPEAISNTVDKDSSTEPKTSSSTETSVVPQSMPEARGETPIGQQETPVETQNTSVETQEESLRDAPIETQETPNDTIASLSTEAHEDWANISMHKAIADQLQVGREQADNDAAAAATMPGSTATPRSTAPTADYTFRAPQSYGQGSFVLPAPVHNPTNNSQPRAPQLTTDSFEQTRANAEYGDVQAQVRLGMMYMQMEGREQHEEAVLWFFKAALRGDAEGQCRVGEMSMKGLGVPQDYRAAIYWFNQAAEQRNANALYYMGNLYSEGLGVSQSDHDAVIWYIRAASEGSAEAQNMMGFRHEIGLGMSRNQSMALEWYLKAAVQGHAGAEESVARLGRNEPPPKDSRSPFPNGGAPSRCFPPPLYPDFRNPPPPRYQSTHDFPPPPHRSSYPFPTQN